ncbi:hypothetical protein NECAME_15122 [Necator americanus]|uniref:Uncharacterized protein n=1 Tax=Necator americanus TaxID=51031 RepID=W2SLJ5_NECAM|nr:hypothetical protein NECAME_15122 [Necator americanus]ETN69736.1 hypothetical protein NECAME_15122 [Necator americanus]
MDGVGCDLFGENSAIMETVITANGVVNFVKEHTPSFGGEKDLAISSMYIYLINDDNIPNKPVCPCKARIPHRLCQI